MARLAAGLAPGFRSQIFGSRFGPAIAGGGFAAIAAVESLTILQLTDFLQQVFDLFFDRQKLVHHYLRLAAGLAQEFLPAV
jgi:hypothetical protein